MTLLDAFREGSSDERRELLARMYENAIVDEGTIKLVVRFPFTLLVRAGGLTIEDGENDAVQ